ncbi:MAG TPA: DNA translocase FtsK [Anaerolineaceae bacterium]|nr:DNA translocase FtsK [Anaerolineaceae bacterium]
MTTKPPLKKTTAARPKTTQKESKTPTAAEARQKASVNTAASEPLPLDPVWKKAKSAFEHIKPFAWDLLGTFLVLLAVLSILGLLGLSRGIWINSWVEFLKRSFGYGSFLIALLFGLGSILVFQFSVGKKLTLPFSRILAYEGLILLSFPLLSLFGGVSVERATEGLDGGVLGWGLAQLLVPILTRTGTFLFYGICFLALLEVATGFLRKMIGQRKTLMVTSGESPKSMAATLPAQSLITDTHTRSKDNQASLKTVPPAEKTVPPFRIDEELPPLSLLMDEQLRTPDEMVIKENALVIERKLAEFGIPVKVIGYRIGPSVTQYAVEPGYSERIGPDGKTVRHKVKVSRITSLSRDLALALAAQRLRIESPVPGKSYVGVEVPNVDSAFVRLKPLLASETFFQKKTPLKLALGRDVSGEPVHADLEKLPHLLIAGTTNSGKSVCVTALTTCLVMNNSPEQLRLVMLDPKMVELVRFNGLPHLMGKVETELERMLAVLSWAQMEMDRRYRLLEEVNARNLTAYNLKMQQKKKPPLPRIVIIIDELADLMMSAPDPTERSLIRLAQMARATGIHMIVATQRPSTDVVTGLIKANFPARISFAVATSVDSRVILDSSGAEELLGRGDMLFLDPARSGLQRIQGVIVSDAEIEKVLKYWQGKHPPSPLQSAPWEEMVGQTSGMENDELIQQAEEIVKAAGRASTSLLQRRLRIGFPRAARLMEELEEMGVIGPATGSGKEREVLVNSEEDPLTEEEFEE